jgi:hypothetical protein
MITRLEELIAALHWIVAILCFAFGYNFFGWVFVVRGALDEVAAIRFAWKEVQKRRRTTVTGSVV